MSKKYYFIFFIFIAVSLNSCKINGGLQGLYSYYNKVRKIDPDLFVKLDEVSNLKRQEQPKVYLVNGNDIYKCIVNNKKSLVYCWGPKCSSKICVPLNLLQNICDKNDIELFVVAEYYDYKLMTLAYDIERPIFGIDTEYYKTNLTSKYVSGFVSDLTSLDMESIPRFLYFENGAYVGGYRSIDDLLDKEKRDNINYHDIAY